MSAAPVPYSLVIATFERAKELAETFRGVEAQEHRPEQVVVVDSSRDGRTELLCVEWAERLPIRWYHSDNRSAAKQRNEGAEQVGPASEIIGFLDDDITMYPNTCAEVCRSFAADRSREIGGIAVRIDGIQRPVPSRWTRLYYRVQAGYNDPTYGGRLFGPAINCLPCYLECAEAAGSLIRADWLNSGCVFYRRDVFLRERFPAFEGYSFMEDVHCSARIAKTHRLYFHTRARCSHRDATNSLKSDHAGLARQRIRNQRIVARDVMGLRGPELWWKFFLHRVFATAAILRGKEPGWKQSLLGTWI